MDTAVRKLLASHPGADRAGLAGALDDVVTAARAAWPTVELPAEAFLAYVAERLPEGDELLSALRSVQASDLYLACACAHGDARAIAAFDLHCLTVVDRALSRLGMDGDLVSEVKQRLRRALLVPEDGPPRIVGFAGRGGLRSWVRVMAVHEAWELTRQARRHVADDEDRLVELASAGATPEVEYLKRMYRRPFETAFRDAIQTLPDRERTLLRQHFLDGVSIHELSTLYRVHRATIGRWLERARDAVLESTRAHLMDRLDVPSAEIESILRLVLSKLEISLGPLFKRRG